MSEIGPNIFEDDDADIDLRRCPADQIVFLLDIVRFDRFLDYIYATLLKREPDREGRIHYRRMAAKGMARVTIVHRLLRSREYRDGSIEAAGLSTDEFVNRAYQDILGRWPDQHGLDTYSRIASRVNGRGKVLKNLRGSAEADRRGGGRLARIEALRAYARAGWPTRFPGLGTWLARRRSAGRRLDRIALNQHLLARQVARLAEEVAAASLAGAEPFGFTQATATHRATPDGARNVAIFHDTLARVRCEI